MTTIITLVVTLNRNHYDLEEIEYWLTMEESESSKDKNAYEVVAEELNRFLKLIKGHEKLLHAIGQL